MTKARGIRRRIFLGGAIGAGAGLLGFPPVVSRQASVSTNSRLWLIDAF